MSATTVSATTVSASTALATTAAAGRAPVTDPPSRTFDAARSSHIAAASTTAMRLFIPLASTTVLLCVYLLAVLTRTGQSFEDKALAAAGLVQNATVLLELVSIPGLAVAAAFITGIALFRRRRGRAVAAVLVIAVSNALTQILKYVVFDRPMFQSPSGDNTFPSGHMTAYVSVCIALLLVLPAALRALASIAGAVISSIVVVQLLAFGWHRLSDVVGAVALVLAVSTFVRLPLGADRRSARGSGGGRSGSGRSASATLRRVSIRVLMAGFVAALAAAAASFVAAFVVDTGSAGLTLLGTECVAVAATVGAFMVHEWLPDRATAM
ncbi:phosphatase PAP2 family protein [Subtercola vilae]|uniref:Phosphatidic acid phosphatase type 2/haloperoxidase domain-containing protein n=1 Tax=Subtercola vilae TaxID=2056433 RepID=A0A4T2BZR3_9MICO|nr:phosphatase PAP2 family protein [Subtercola vilae]TIH37110.1 hypothetical protein D4765_08810 [Subtercola vilae]